MDATLSSSTRSPIYRRRLLVNRFNLAMSLAAMAFGMTFLLWILIVLVGNGFAALSPWRGPFDVKSAKLVYAGLAIGADALIVIVVPSTKAAASVLRTPTNGIAPPEIGPSTGG